MDKSFLIFLAIPFFFLLIGIELIYGYIKGKNNYRLNDAITSINIGLISRFPTILNLGLQGAAFAYAANYWNLKLLPTNSAFTWIFAFVFYDFLYYWMHRLSHEIKFLWATHVVHHHGEEFNLATALRQTSSGFLLKWIFFMPMFIVGIPGEVFITVGGLNLIYQFWVHTEHIPKLGWYEKIFITPSNHRIHHAKNPEYIDANYGGVFILFDRWFGTFKEERDDLKPTYGTVKALRSWNPIWANIEVFFGIIRDSIFTKNWKDKMRVWYAPTRWRPHDVSKRFPSNPENIDFYDKYNPIIPTYLKLFAWIQSISLSPITLVIFFTLPDQGYLQTAIFGVILIASSTIISLAFVNSSYTLLCELLRSVLVVTVLLMNVDLFGGLLATNFILIHAYLNIIYVCGIKLLRIDKQKPKLVSS